MTRARGKKFEMFYVKNHGEIEIRFDSNRSLFFAEFMDKTYEDKDLNKLKEELKEAISNADTTIWSPMIRIEMETWRTHDTVFVAERKMLGIRERDGKIEKIVAGAHIPNGGDEEFYNDPKNWVATTPYHELNEEDNDVKIIPYTIEKWKALQLILAKLEQLRTKLREIVFSDKADTFLEKIYAHRDNVKLLQYDEGREE